jgi:type IV pilus assembly protein PilO
VSKKYSMSKNEFILITVLIFLAVIVIIGNYFILPAWQELTATRELHARQAQQLENLRREHEKIDVYREQEEELGKEIAAVGVSIPGFYAQEEIVAAISAASQQSELDVVNITFGGRVMQSKDAFLTQLTNNGGEGSSAGSVEPGAMDVVTAERLTLNVSGSFAEYMRFLSTFELGARRVFFRSATLNAAPDGQLTGTMNLLVFSVGEVPETFPGYAYDAPVPSGRSDPFEPFEGGAGGGGGIVQTGSPDFYIILSSSLDNDSGVQMGRYPISATQVATDKNSQVAATLTLSGSDTISYRYTLDGKTYSGTLESEKDTITVSVLSRARKSADDNVGITLDVTNDTGKTVVISVRNDDTINPRFTLGTTSGTVLLG